MDTPSGHMSNPLSAPGTTAQQHRKRRGKKCHNIPIPYMAGVSDIFRRIFTKHYILVNFRPCNTLRQKLVHPKDKTPRQKLNNVVYVRVWGLCCSFVCLAVLLHVSQCGWLISHLTWPSEAAPQSTSFGQ